MATFGALYDVTIRASDLAAELGGVSCGWTAARADGSRPALPPRVMCSPASLG
jgi:hypothetical protein